MVFIIYAIIIVDIKPDSLRIGMLSLVLYCDYKKKLIL